MEKAGGLEWRCGKSKRFGMEMRKKQADWNGDVEKASGLE
jgi:hypothetical protein